jgi:hypothetical protein
VTVVVTCRARDEATFSALRIAEAGIGEPASWQASWRGLRRRLLSRELSHWECT